jgi:alpha/beta superfamily hydrolase/acyltransferase
MEKLIPDAGLVAFDDAGHYSFLDKPYEFNTVLQNFLQDDIKRKS